MKHYNQTMIGDLAPSASGSFQIGTAQTPFASGCFGDVFSGRIYISGATSGKATIVTPSAAGTPTLTLPTSTGTVALTSDIVASVTLVNAMGNVSGTISPVIDKVNTAVLTDNVVLTMPTPTTAELHTLVFEFTMGSAYTVTISSLTWNFGSTPVLATGATINRLTLETIDGGSSWKGYYSQF